jgi:nitroimidazol reductase NimA-like FMN-containing flavoprotein (pyridoxamine 5'-phosphate oxidase superfamily)
VPTSNYGLRARNGLLRLEPLQPDYDDRGQDPERYADTGSQHRADRSDHRANDQRYDDLEDPVRTALHRSTVASRAAAGSDRGGMGAVDGDGYSGRMSQGAGADPTRAVALDPSACWDLLRRTSVGRVAVLRDGAPEIFPINFAVDHGAVVFRTGAGAKLEGALSGQAVAFEADGFDVLDDERARAWSVVLKGRAELVHDIAELVDTYDLPMYPWEGSPKHNVVRIVADRVTGRRFDIVDSSWWQVRRPGRHSAPE